VRNHYTLRLAMSMWKFVTRGQSTRTYPGLPDPEKAPTLAAAASMKAANDEIITHLNGKSITSSRCDRTVKGLFPRLLELKSANCVTLTLIQGQCVVGLCCDRTVPPDCAWTVCN
jgi:hypothetical protein